MEATQVLYTSLSKGDHQVAQRSSYLDNIFFEEYPRQDPTQQPGEGQSSEPKTKSANEANMHQVSISMVQVSWIKDWDTVARGFFRAAIDSGDLELFKNRVMIEIINYMWSIMRSYFIWYRFVPFLLFMYIPMTVFTFVPIEDTKGNEKD